MPIRLVALALLLSALLLAQQPVSLPRAFWNGEQPQSPKLPATEDILDFTLEKATATDGSPTVAMFAACRFPGRLADAYGARVGGATQVVAINLATGAAFTAPAERPNSATLPTRAQHHSDGAHSTVDSIEVWFNADLRAHLGLPPGDAEYGVFLWTDGMTSTLHVAEVPASASASTSSAPVVDSKGIRFRRSILSPQVADHRFRIRPSSTGETIFGALDLKGVHASKIVLTVLVLNGATREVSAHSLQFCRKSMEKSAGRFDIDASQWVKIGVGSSIIAITSGLLSNPVSVP